MTLLLLEICNSKYNNILNLDAPPPPSSPSLLPLDTENTTKMKAAIIQMRPHQVPAFLNRILKLLYFALIMSD